MKLFCISGAFDYSSKEGEMNARDKWFSEDTQVEGRIVRAEDEHDAMKAGLAQVLNRSGAADELSRIIHPKERKEENGETHYSFDLNAPDWEGWKVLITVREVSVEIKD